jgi:hypothetical protein
VRCHTDLNAPAPHRGIPRSSRHSGACGIRPARAGRTASPRSLRFVSPVQGGRSMATRLAGTLTPTPIGRLVAWVLALYRRPDYRAVPHGGHVSRTLLSSARLGGLAVALCAMLAAGSAAGGTAHAAGAAAHRHITGSHSAARVHHITRPGVQIQCPPGLYWCFASRGSARRGGQDRPRHCSSGASQRECRLGSLAGRHRAAL